MTWWIAHKINQHQVKQPACQLLSTVFKAALPGTTHRGAVTCHRLIEKKMRKENQLKILATDLDGTLIPLADNPQNQRDLQTLKDALRKNQSTMMFVTGRHFGSVIHAIEEFDLPIPEWIICDVGTSIYKLKPAPESLPEIGSHFEQTRDYAFYLRRLIGAYSATILRDELTSVSGIRLQEEQKQGHFKLSYYAEARELDELCSLIQTELNRNKLPWSIIASVDPFNGDGLIDLLPAGCSKAFALDWLIRHLPLDESDVVFAGDSGNDFAAMTSGLKSIVVANADREFAKRVHDEHVRQGWKDRLFLATDQATSGVLQGCQQFGFLPRDSSNPPHRKAVGSN